jgi:hypothetical protein
MRLLTPNSKSKVNLRGMWGHVGIRRRAKAGLGLNICGSLACQYRAAAHIECAPETGHSSPAPGARPREVLGLGLGAARGPKRREPSLILRCVYKRPSVAQPGGELTIEVEANVTERIPHFPVQRLLAAKLALANRPASAIHL